MARESQEEQRANDGDDDKSDPDDVGDDGGILGEETTDSGAGGLSRVATRPRSGSEHRTSSAPSDKDS